ncbi:acyltransferase family protein [Pantoea sp. NPDC088449]|uniref:acyltransferase family protein n=1 Tax=Pantoea sp. NPDC088449 TaxID=3364392 RepID=UPI003802D728
MVTNKSIDTFKGIMIFLVIFGHSIEGLISNKVILVLYNFIYTFHMPAFALISGYLSKGDSELDVNKLTKSILIPFIFFSVIYEVPYILETGSISWYLQGLSPNRILWYLVSLFSWRLITPFVMRFRMPLLIVFIIAILSPCVPYNGYIFSIGRTLVFFPFYLLGVMLFINRGGVSLLVDKVSGVAAFYTSMVVMLILACIMQREFFYGSVSYVAFNYPNYLGVAIRLAMYASVSVFLMRIFYMAYENRVLTRFGQYSLYIYLIHGVFIKYLSLSVYSLNNNTFVRMVMCLVLSFIVAYMLSLHVVKKSVDFIFSKIYSILTVD